jgi:hypothetical protein
MKICKEFGLALTMKRRGKSKRTNRDEKKQPVPFLSSVGIQMTISKPDPVTLVLFPA